MSRLQKSLMNSRLPPCGSALNSNLLPRRNKDYGASPWNNYFSERKEVNLDDKNVFCVYQTGPPDKIGPILLLLHGGGYSALTWGPFSVEISKLVHCRCLSIDLRGHGDSVTENDDDISAATLAKDVGNVVKALYAEDCPPIILIGHSMGGAVAIHMVFLNILPTLIGISVIDVVEGTAMEALTSMQSYLRTRPKFFHSIPSAIEWSFRSGQTRNIESAKVSMPGQIVNSSTRKLAATEITFTSGVTQEYDSQRIVPKDTWSIPEDSEEISTNLEIPPTIGYTWRIDLSKSEKHWAGWFEGLSKKFLSLTVPKLLLLASIDGLDRALTVGQMQGKFQMAVLPRCGHAVHEDRPYEVAEVIASFLSEVRECVACGELISDRYLMEVDGCIWHSSCLRCCICFTPLDQQQSCFLREKQLYCKIDYSKIFGAKCSKCCRGISASDWVRKAKEFVFHLACFACDSCGRQLSTGEQFALADDRVLCKAHYVDNLEGGATSSDDGFDGDGYHKSKTKRVRTTFTEEQLQILQANFQLDSNPDGQDLERIASVTGLSKRVTQVWFQNSRARQKKHIHAGKPKARDTESQTFSRQINLQLTYAFENNIQNNLLNINRKATSHLFHDSSLEDLSQDSSTQCLQHELE